MAKMISGERKRGACRENEPASHLTWRPFLRQPGRMAMIADLPDFCVGLVVCFAVLSGFSSLIGWRRRMVAIRMAVGV